MMPSDPTQSPEQAQQHDANEPCQDKTKQQSSSSASVIRSLASLFSAEADELDATELRMYDGQTRKTPQTRHGSDHDGDLQGGHATPNPSYPYEAGDINTGSTTPEHRSSSGGARAPSSTISTPSLEGVPSRSSAFWKNNISVVVPFKDARDHLGRQLYSTPLLLPSYNYLLFFSWSIASILPCPFFLFFLFEISYMPIVVLSFLLFSGYFWLPYSGIDPSF